MHINTGKKSESAFETKVYTVCMCDDCLSKGSKQMFSDLSDMVKAQKRDPFVRVKTIRLKDGHDGGPVFM